jgi:hypothetical protein
MVAGSGFRDRFLGQAADLCAVLGFGHHCAISSATDWPIQSAERGNARPSHVPYSRTGHVAGARSG